MPVSSVRAKEKPFSSSASIPRWHAPCREETQGGIQWSIRGSATPIVNAPIISAFAKAQSCMKEVRPAEYS